MKNKERIQGLNQLAFYVTFPIPLIVRGWVVFSQSLLTTTGIIETAPFSWMVGFFLASFPLVFVSALLSSIVFWSVTKLNVKQG
jgi:hypothetical protein